MTKKGMFDTHAHYNDERFLSAPEGQEGILSYVLGEGGVDNILNASCDLEDSKKSIELAKKYPQIYAAAGIHPHEAKQYAGDISGAMAELSKLLDGEKVVALGEIGLDFHYNFSTPEDQRSVFEAQMALAKEKNMPVIIHDREAHGATMEILRKFKPVKGIMHSFSGSAEMIKELENIGFYISFSGSLTFKNAVNLTAAAKTVSEDRLLIETDAPYLAPVPHRGKTNNSALMYHTAEKLAEVRGVTVEEIIDITGKNAKRFFGV